MNRTPQTGRRFQVYKMTRVCLILISLSIVLWANSNFAVSKRYQNVVQQESFHIPFAKEDNSNKTKFEYVLASEHTKSVSIPFQRWEGYTHPDYQKLNFIKSMLRSVRVSSPGVSKITDVLFLDSNPGWLSARTFTAAVFVCPNNGHEGSITHLFNQILSDISIQGLCKPLGKQCAVLDVGSNLGFYSLLSAKLGYLTYAFDLQPVCLHGLNLMSAFNEVQDTVFLFNLAVADRRTNVTSSGHSCDYENYLKATEFIDEKSLTMMESRSKRKTSVLNGQHAIRASTVQAVPLDVVVLSSSILAVPLLKIDTEGAEVLVLRGAMKILSLGIVKNVIVELTPGHWFRFGLDVNSSAGIDVISSLTETLSFEAFVLFIPVARRPPVRLAHIVHPVHSHPMLPKVSNLGCNDESGKAAVMWKVLDMRAFIVEYCLNHLATVSGGVNMGFCGNIWFHLKE